MNFNSFRFSLYQKLLLPFSLIYGLIIICRNLLYDKQLITSVSFNLPVIGVGNLSVGGTGKSPMVEYLLTLLQNKYNLATISRGYKRKTTGYFLAATATTAAEIGDEPMQFHTKFRDVAVAVGEKRIEAIPKLRSDRPETDVIILDDSFQHRSIKPGFNILLTAYPNLFTKDFFLPTGSLRDQKSSYKRAEVIVVTKCPADINDEERRKVKEEIALIPGQQLFFTSLQYQHPYHFINKEKKVINRDTGILLVTGIADPAPLFQHLSKTAGQISTVTFPDHHTFSSADVKSMGIKLNRIDAKEKIIVTTEKDIVRLMEFKDVIKDLPIYVLPVTHHFLFGEGICFELSVTNFIERFSRNKDKYE